MKSALLVFLALTHVLGTSPSWADGVTLTIHDGMVTLEADDVTVGQILAVWARVGKTDIVNAESLTSEPMTLTLDRIPERQALSIILRDVPGYLAQQRASYLNDASIYDRILIMETTTAQAAVAIGGLPEERPAALDESASPAAAAAGPVHVPSNDSSNDFARSSSVGLAPAPPPAVTPTTVPSRPPTTVPGQPPTAVPYRPPTTVPSQEPTTVPSRPLPPRPD